MKHGFTAAECALALERAFGYQAGMTAVPGRPPFVGNASDLTLRDVFENPEHIPTRRVMELDFSDSDKTPIVFTGGYRDNARPAPLEMLRDHDPHPSWLVPMPRAVLELLSLR